LIVRQALQQCARNDDEKMKKEALISGGAHKALAGIAVKVVAGPPAKMEGGFHWKRRAIQGLVLALLILIPVSGLFRIDPVAGAFIVLDRQIWFSDFFLVTGLWIVLASGLVALYSTAGTVFCGWACPQNTVSEWANYMTHKLLGKRAEVSLNGEAPLVAAAKNKSLNWVILGVSFLLAAMLFALLPLFYFYPPDVIWSFVTFRADTRLAGSLHWIYAVCTLIILLDIAVIRHFWCRFACIYRVWQHSFKTRETLHVSYDASRAEECIKCGYCVTTCFVGLDPRKTDIYDSCINCGECIDACNHLHAKTGGDGLLRFEIGERKKKDKQHRFRDNTMSLISRLGWTIPFTVLGALMFAWGIWAYDPYHLSVGRLEAPNLGESTYRIAIASKRYQPTRLKVRVEGLPPSEFHLSTQEIQLDPVGRASIILSIAPGLQHGLYPIDVEVQAQDGWTGHFNIQHFAG